MYCGACEDRRRFGGVKRWGGHCACSVPGIEHLHLAGSGESSLAFFRVAECRLEKTFQDH